jgi:hypothetical protein
MSRDDAVAIKAYIFSLPAVHKAPPPDQLSFPFNQRWTMAFWNLAVLDAHAEYSGLFRGGRSALILRQRSPLRRVPHTPQHRFCYGQ